MTRCAGLFRPGDTQCRICDYDKSSHQTDHRSGTQPTARILRCRCGNEKPLAAIRCETCESRLQWESDHDWLWR